MYIHIMKEEKKRIGYKSWSSVAEGRKEMEDVKSFKVLILIP